MFKNKKIGFILNKLIKLDKLFKNKKIQFIINLIIIR